MKASVRRKGGKCTECIPYVVLNPKAEVAVHLQRGWGGWGEGVYKINDTTAPLTAYTKMHLYCGNSQRHVCNLKALCRPILHCMFACYARRAACYAAQLTVGITVLFMAELLYEALAAVGV